MSVAPEVRSPRACDSLAMAVGLLDSLVVALEAREPHGGLADTPPGEGAIAGEQDTWADRIQRVRRERIALDREEAAERREADAAKQPAGDARIATGRIEDYLRQRNPRGRDLLVKKIDAPLGGYSKDTLIVHLAGADRPADAVVLRCDSPFSPLEGSAADELEVLRAVHAAGIPVAEALWCERDASVLGRAFLVSRLVSGQPVMNYRQEPTAEIGRDVAEKFVQLLADIHSIDLPRVASFRGAVERPMAAQVSSMLDAFEAQWNRHCERQSAIVTAAFAWMRGNLPRSDSVGRIVHGDATFRNLMLDDGRVTALLDWETWHIGDPVEDLAYCRDEIERYLSTSQWQALYASKVGRPVDQDRLRYWSLWKWLRGSVTSVTLKAKVNSDAACDLRTAFGGIHFTRLCLRQLAEGFEHL